MAAIDRARRRGLTQEHREHPAFPTKVTEQLVEDHLKLYGARAYPKKRN